MGYDSDIFISEACFLAYEFAILNLVAKRGIF